MNKHLIFLPIWSRFSIYGRIWKVLFRHIYYIIRAMLDCIITATWSQRKEKSDFIRRNKLVLEVFLGVFVLFWSLLGNRGGRGSKIVKYRQFLLESIQNVLRRFLIRKSRENVFFRHSKFLGTTLWNFWAILRVPKPKKIENLPFLAFQKFA